MFCFNSFLLFLVMKLHPPSLSSSSRNILNSFKKCVNFIGWITIRCVTIMFILKVRSLFITLKQNLLIYKLSHIKRWNNKTNHKLFLITRSSHRTIEIEKRSNMVENILIHVSIQFIDDLIKNCKKLVNNLKDWGYEIVSMLDKNIVKISIKSPKIKKKSL